MPASLPKDPWSRTDSTQPVVMTIPAQRNANLDAIRGLAVLGIFFMNIYFMGITFFGYAPTKRRRCRIT
ncbi:hypothetical protein LFREDSHE_14100 [Shewanella baltica]